jgi:hypothetical protein
VLDFLTTGVGFIIAGMARTETRRLGVSYARNPMGRKEEYLTTNDTNGTKKEKMIAESFF